MNIKEAIKNLKGIDIKNFLSGTVEQSNCIVDRAEETTISIETVLAELEKKDNDITKLKDNNKELLRKLKNRVKEVKKLEKYSLYKKEFSTLNKHLEKKSRIIDKMAERLTTDIHSKEWVIDYYEREVER